MRHTVIWACLAPLPPLQASTAIPTLQNKINLVNTTVNRLNTNVNILNAFKNATQPLVNIKTALSPLPAGARSPAPYAACPQPCWL